MTRNILNKKYKDLHDYRYIEGFPFGKARKKEEDLFTESQTSYIRKKWKILQEERNKEGHRLLLSGLLLACSLRLSMPYW